MSIKNIVLNSGILYGRMILVMFITLYTTRLLLKNLGVAEFGLYSVISSFVVLGAFITGILTTASQRFLSEVIARGDKKQITKTFQACLTVHLLLAIVVFILLEVTGLLYIKYQLVQNITSAGIINIIFQCSLLVFSVSIIFSLFSAVFIAEENMSLYSKISVFDVFFKFIIASCLVFFPKNNLIAYSVLLLMQSLILLVIAIIVLNIKYKNYKLKISLDVQRIKNILSFVIWSIWGGVATVLNNQGVNLLLNTFFGLYINVARTISIQVSSAFLQVINSVLMAVNPQLVKAYSMANELYFRQLLIVSSKIISVLAIIMFVVLFNNTTIILNIWLHDVPKYTVIFVQLILVDVFINTLSAPMILAVQASGRIKLYQTIVGGLLILNLPVAYACLHYTNKPEFVYYTGIFFSVLAMMMRIIFLNILLGIKLWNYLYQVIFKSVVMLFIVTLCMRLLIPEVGTFIQFILFSLVTCIISLILFVLVGLERKEKKIGVDWLKSRLNNKY